MRIPDNPDWGWIKTALHEQGMTMQEIADRLGIHRSTVNKVKTQTHYRSQAAIAGIIGCKPEQLWPDRYPQGKPYIFDSRRWGTPERQKSSHNAVRAAGA